MSGENYGRACDFLKEVEPPNLPTVVESLVILGFSGVTSEEFRVTESVKLSRLVEGTVG